MGAHEIFAAQTAREMVQSGDWVHPTYNGQSRLKKPPLMYWMQAGASVVLGASAPVPPWIARLPSAIAAGVIAGIAVVLGRRVYGAATGVTAGLISIGCLGFVEFAWSARPDMLYGACCSLMLLGSVSATLPERSERSRRLDAWTGWVGFALATLAKGPHVPGIILVGVILHLVIARRGRELLGVVRPLAGVVIMIAVCAPWFGAILLTAPDTPGLWAQQLFAGREAEKDSSLVDWLNPVYLYALPEQLLPWAILLPFAAFVAFQKGREDLARGRVLIWIVLTVVVLMSIPNHRRGYYMLPIFAPLAVLMARGALDWLERIGRSEKVRRRIGFAACLCCSIAGGALVSRAIANEEDLAQALTMLGAVMMVGIAVLLWKHGRSEAWSPSGLLMRLAMAPIVLFAATSSDEEWKDGYLIVTHRFAREVRDRVGESSAVAFFRMPDAGLPYAQCVYALERVVPEAQSSEELDGLAPEGSVWVILRSNHVEELEARWRCAVELEAPPDDAGEPSVLLVRCERRE